MPPEKRCFAVELAVPIGHVEPVREQRRVPCHVSSRTCPVNGVATHRATRLPRMSGASHRAGKDLMTSGLAAMSSRCVTVTSEDPGFVMAKTTHWCLEIHPTRSLTPMAKRVQPSGEAKAA